MFPTLYGIASQAGGNWWEAGGATGATHVYQPKGAESLAASYTDLSENGNDAAVGVAPTWNLTDGWVFNGTTQYLISNWSIVDSSQSVFIQYTDATETSENGLLGSYRTTAPSGATIITLHHPSSSNGVGFFNGTLASNGKAPNQTLGNLGFAGKQTYRNGLIDVVIPGGDQQAGAVDIFIGAMAINGGIANPSACKIQAVVRYDNELTQPQVAAVSAAMAAL